MNSVDLFHEVGGPHQISDPQSSTFSACDNLCRLKSRPAQSGEIFVFVGEASESLDASYQIGREDVGTVPDHNLVHVVAGMTLCVNQVDGAYSFRATLC